MFKSQRAEDVVKHPELEDIDPNLDLVTLSLGEKWQYYLLHFLHRTIVKVMKI